MQIEHLEMITISGKSRIHLKDSNKEGEVEVEYKWGVVVLVMLVILTKMEIEKSVILRRKRETVMKLTTTQQILVIH